LTPLDWRQWGLLTVIALFVGGGGTGFPSGNVSSFGNAGGGDADGAPSLQPAIDWLTGNLELVVIAVVAIALAVLAFGLLGALLEVALVESLRTETVRIRAYATAYWPLAVRLFGFRLAVGLVALLGLIGTIVAVVGPLFFGWSVATLALVPVTIACWLVAALVGAFTTTLVVPIMLDRECGPLVGWRHMWGSLTDNRAGYAGYFVVGGLASAVLNMAVSFVVLFAAVIVGLLFLFFGAVVWFAAGGTASLPVLVTAAVLVGVFFLLLLVGGAAARVPVMVFLRYYGMLVLGDLSPALDPIPDVRAAVRADDGG
jgi:hypothetical protein